MSTELPLISVIIATYNYSTVLRCAIESALLQTIQDFEIIVIGDGCTDDSEAVVRSFNDERISWENLPENTGNQGLPNMHGLSMAQGRYIAYLNHDDLWLPRHLEHLTNTLERHNKAATISMMLRFGNPNVGGRYISGLDGNFNYHTSSVTMHRRGLGLQAEWRNLRELPSDISTEVDFGRRLREIVGEGFMPTKHVTMLNFPAVMRPNSYKEKKSDEQEYYLERIKQDDDLLAALLLETINLTKEGKYYRQDFVWSGKRTGKAGEGVEAMRRIKGLEGDGREIGKIHVDTNPIIHALRQRFTPSKLPRRIIEKIKLEWSKFRNRRRMKN